jgi:hypothetical protein
MASMPPGPCGYLGLGFRDPGTLSTQHIFGEQAYRLLGEETQSAGTHAACMAQGEGGMRG